jgi:hypothetical protein
LGKQGKNIFQENFIQVQICKCHHTQKNNDGKIFFASREFSILGKGDDIPNEQLWARMFWNVNEYFSFTSIFYFLYVDK